MNTLVYAPWRWLLAIPLMLLATLLCGLLCLAMLVFLPPHRVNRLAPVWWARALLAVVPAPVSVRGREHIDPRQSYVVVANHLSHMDIPVVYASLGMDLRWVMKAELRQVPVIGVCSAGLGHIFVDRNDNRAAVASLREARARLVDGASVIFFPEGTRSRDGDLHAFKKGAFVTARDMGLPILPVTIRNTDAVLPPDTLAVLPSRVEIVVHRPIAAGQVASVPVDELLRDTRAIIASALPPDRVHPA